MILGRPTAFERNLAGIALDVDSELARLQPERVAEGDQVMRAFRPLPRKGVKQTNLRSQRIFQRVKQIIVIIQKIGLEEQRERARKKEIRPSTNTRLYWGYVIKGGGLIKSA